MAIHCERAAEAVITDRDLNSASIGRRRRHVELRDAYERLWTDTIREGIDLGQFCVADPALARLAILGSASSVMTWYQPDGRLTPDQIGDAYAELVSANDLRTVKAHHGRESSIVQAAATDNPTVMESRGPLIGGMGPLGRADTTPYAVGRKQLRQSHAPDLPTVRQVRWSAITRRTRARPPASTAPVPPIPVPTTEVGLCGPVPARRSAWPGR